MANILFVKANPRPIEQAVSVKLYEAFLNSYKETHPGDTVTELDLFVENLPVYNLNMISGMYKLGNGLELTAEEKQATDLVNRYLDQFVAADKVVFAFPMWNFTVPAPLHTYLDYMCQAGKTFKYTQEGPIGLLGGKKVALLHARGGVYSEGPAAAVEHALSYVKSVLSFIGVKDFTTVIVEGHNQFPDRAEEIVQTGVKQASEEAARF